MRATDILLIIILFAVNQFACIGKVINRKLNKALGIALGIFATLVFSFKMSSWQMVPLLLYSLVLAVIMAAVTNGRRKRFTTAIGYFCVAITILLFYSFPIFKLPELTGEYKVGRKSYHMVDSERLETLTEDANDYRELMVDIWYPCNEKGKKAPYIQEADKVLPELAKSFQLPEFILSHLSKVKSNSNEAITVSEDEQNYPVLIFSPGYGSSRYLYTAMIEQWASSGYIVASIDHPYNSSVNVVYPDGRESKLKININDEREMDKLNDTISISALDQLFVLDQLEKINKTDAILKNKLDLKEVALIGHSFGGASSVLGGYQDNRIKAVVNYDGSIHGDALDNSLRVPTMVIKEESYKSLLDYSSQELKDIFYNSNFSKDKAEEIYAKSMKEAEFLKSVGEKGGLISIKGTKHLSFSDIPLYTPLAASIGMVGDLEPNKTFEIVNKYTLDFLDHYLKGKESKLLLTKSSPYSEVVYLEK